jgi:hypothetical protein
VRQEQAVNKMAVEPAPPAAQPEQQQAFMQALTTEHFTLQTARAVAVNEGNGRTALYIGRCPAPWSPWPWSLSGRPLATCSTWSP